MREKDVDGSRLRTMLGLICFGTYFSMVGLLIIASAQFVVLRETFAHVPEKWQVWQSSLLNVAKSVYRVEKSCTERH
jgi:hypothetical protein